jgi:hypothetical protein
MQSSEHRCSVPPMTDLIVLNHLVRDLLKAGSEARVVTQTIVANYAVDLDVLAATLAAVRTTGTGEAGRGGSGLPTIV